MIKHQKFGTDPLNGPRPDIILELRENQLWGDIRRLAKTDPALQEELERVIIYYRLKYEQR